MYLFPAYISVLTVILVKKVKSTVKSAGVQCEHIICMQICFNRKYRPSFVC